jgi:hypothetical protein
MTGDVGWPRQPDPIEFRMRQYAAQPLAQREKAVRLARDHGVQRDRENQGRLLALLDHLFELTDHCVDVLQDILIELTNDHKIIELDRIGNVEQRPRTRPQQTGLIVDRPVEGVAVARLLQEIERNLALRHQRCHPAVGRLALVACNRVGRLGDERALLVLRPPAGPFGIGATVADEFVSALADCLAHLGMSIVEVRAAFDLSLLLRCAALQTVTFCYRSHCVPKYLLGNTYERYRRNQ